MPATFVSRVAGSRALRSVERPDGSPIDPVAPPIYERVRFSILNQLSSCCPNLKGTDEVNSPVRSSCDLVVENAVNRSKRVGSQRVANLLKDQLRGKLSSASQRACELLGCTVHP